MSCREQNGQRSHPTLGNGPLQRTVRFRLRSPNTRDEGFLQNRGGHLQKPYTKQKGADQEQLDMPSPRSAEVVTRTARES
jgi:hypothetical protein